MEEPTHHLDYPNLDEEEGLSTGDDDHRALNTENDFEELSHQEAPPQEAWSQPTAAAFSTEYESQPSNTTNDLEKLLHQEAPAQEAWSQPTAPPAVEHETFSEKKNGAMASGDREAPHEVPALHRRADDYGADSFHTERRSQFEEEDSEDDVKGPAEESTATQEIPTASEASEMLKQRIPPRVRKLLYWECPVTSAVVLSALLLFQLSLLFFSVISVLAYTGLFIMLLSLGLRLYAHFVSGGSSDSIHRYMEADWSISREKTEQVSRVVLEKINAYALYVRDLFTIANYGESIKFVVFLYLLTYIGAWFNFLTLIILATVFSFSIPKVYDVYKREIDHVICLARRQFKHYWAIVREKMSELPVIGAKMKHQ